MEPRQGQGIQKTWDSEDVGFRRRGGGVVGATWDSEDVGEASGRHGTGRRPRRRGKVRGGGAGDVRQEVVGRGTSRQWRSLDVPRRNGGGGRQHPARLLSDKFFSEEKHFWDNISIVPRSTPSTEYMLVV